MFHLPPGSWNVQGGRISVTYNENVYTAFSIAFTSDAHPCVTSTAAAYATIQMSSNSKTQFHVAVLKQGATGTVDVNWLACGK